MIYTLRRLALRDWHRQAWAAGFVLLTLVLAGEHHRAHRFSRRQACHRKPGDNMQLPVLNIEFRKSIRRHSPDTGAPGGTEAEAPADALPSSVPRNLNFFYGSVSGAARNQPGRKRQTRHRVHRSFRLRQVDVPAHAEPDERDRAPQPRGRRDPAGRRKHFRDGRLRSPPPRGHGVSKVQSVSQVDFRQRRLRPAHQRDTQAGPTCATRWSTACAAPRCGTK